MTNNQEIINQICEDCEEYKNDVRTVDICGFEYLLCKECETERDLNDEMDSVYDGEVFE